MSIIVAVLVFGLIVLIHEFGHFIVAKKWHRCDRIFHRDGAQSMEF